MSTKTTIKRIALVAVSALGFGMLSVVPSQAVVSGALTITTANGSGSVTAGTNDTSTAATISVSGLVTTNLDSFTVSVVRKSGPAASTNVAFKLGFVETTTSSVSQIERNGITGTSLVTVTNGSKNTAGTLAYDSTTAFTTGQSQFYNIYATGAGYTGATINLMTDTSTANARVAGAYVYTAIIQTYSDGKLSNTQSADVTFTINDTAANTALVSGTIDPSKTTAVLNTGVPTTFSSTDSAVAVVATAASTNHASIQVKTYTSTSLPAPESVTVTLTGTAGVICDAASGTAICGTNLTAVGTGGSTTFYIRANGTAGTSTIVVKTTTKTFPAKTVSFFAKSPKTITVATNTPVIPVAAASSNTDVVRAVAKDADGIVWGGQLYIIASAAADALIAGSATTPTACTFDSTYGYHKCPLKGTAKGTASVKVMDASLDTDGTIATTDAAVTSDATTVRVSTGSASSVKIAFDKATYAPGDKAYITIRVLDENGDAMPAGTISNVFVSAPSANVAWGSGTTATFATSVAIAGATDADTDKNAGAETFVVYMPQATGTVTLSGTGSTGLAASGRVAVSASAEVVNESVTAAVDAANDATEAANAATDAANAAAEAADAATAAAQDAQAAVADLAAQVATLISGIKAQITRLTNLVIKIQKKVNA